MVFMGFSGAHMMKAGFSEKHAHLQRRAICLCSAAKTAISVLLEGTNDNGKAINAYWCTPQDAFGSISRVKTVSEKGGVAVIKRIQNGLLKVAASTDKQSFCDVCRAVTEGFSFKRVKFAEMNFGTGSRGSVCFKVKRRNIWQMQLKFYSDEKDKPFGLFEATLEYKTGKYFK